MHKNAILKIECKVEKKKQKQNNSSNHINQVLKIL